MEPQFVEFDGDDPLAFVLSKNLHRRHLNESQWSMVAVRMATMRKGRPEKNGQIYTFIPEAAESLNVSERSVKSARKVIDLGLPELTHIVEQGQMPVSTAAAVAELPDAEQEKIVRIMANNFADFCKQVMLEYAETHALDHNVEVQIEV